MSANIEDISCIKRKPLRMGEEECYTVEISVSARKLRDVDLFSVSDPICVLQTRERDGPWREFGKTEPIINNLDPDFVKKFNLCYSFQRKQYLRFLLYDVDDKKETVKLSDFLGQFECTLGKLVSCLKITAPLEDNKDLRKSGGKKPKGSIFVVAEKQLQKSSEEINMLIMAENLEKTSTFRKINAYLRFSKESDDGGYTVVHRTETVKKDSCPTWEWIRLSVNTLCNGEADRNLRIECFDDKNGEDKLIGECVTTLAKLRASGAPLTNFLINIKKKGSKECAKLTITNMTFENRHQFIDYIYGGMQIRVTVGVDFSQSNGRPSSPKSLHHFIQGGPLNQYARAIQSVGEILEDYDSDKQIPAFGFGAKNQNTKEVLNLFALNGDVNKPECDGIRAVYSHYYNQLQTMELYGPSNFAPLIRNVSQQAAQLTDGSEYHILLILTNGNIDDMAETKKEIIQAAKYPMSIIIVGIGPDDFEAMKMLDSDDKPLAHRRDVAARDIVQFVAFREYDPLNTRDGSENVKNHDCLGKEVLREVPNQVMTYMRTNQISPGRSTRNSTLV